MKGRRGKWIVQPAPEASVAFHSFTDGLWKSLWSPYDITLINSAILSWTQLTEALCFKGLVAMRGSLPSQEVSVTSLTEEEGKSKS